MHIFLCYMYRKRMKLTCNVLSKRNLPGFENLPYVVIKYFNPNTNHCSYVNSRKKDHHPSPTRTKMSLSFIWESTRFIDRICSLYTVRKASLCNIRNAPNLYYTDADKNWFARGVPRWNIESWLGSPYVSPHLIHIGKREQPIILWHYICTELTSLKLQIKFSKMIKRPNERKLLKNRK